MRERDAAQSLRSIPTCVGFTYMEDVEAPERYGPSPRAWGLRCASRLLQADGSVHPHVRGVYGPLKCCPDEDDGPSPRAWGLLSQP